MGDRPEDWSPATQGLVNALFGGRLNPPLIGDAAAFHGEDAHWTGQNAVFFDGRVEKTKKP